MFHIKVFACASGCLQTLDLIQYIYSDLTNTHCNKSLTIIEKKGHMENQSKRQIGLILLQLNHRHVCL